MVNPLNIEWICGQICNKIDITMENDLIGEIYRKFPKLATPIRNLKGPKQWVEISKEKRKRRQIKFEFKICYDFI